MGLTDGHRPTAERPAPHSAVDIENALIVASLAHATAKTPKQRHEAWERLQALRALRPPQR